MTHFGEQGSSRPMGFFVRRVRKPNELRGLLDEAAHWPWASVSDFPPTRYRNGRTPSGKDESISPEFWKARFTIRARDWPAGQRSVSTLTPHDRFVVEVVLPAIKR